MIAWLKNYLSGRSAYITINGSTSRTFPLHKGVPQGSCLGPVIFIVYHHDILNSISMLHWKHLFADDLAVLVSSSANWSSETLIPNLVQQIKEVVVSLVSYSQKWKQPINFQKTFWVLFHRQVAPNIPPFIDCNGHSIFHSKEIKYLGTILDCKMSFSTHISYIESKIRKNLSIFKYLSSNRVLSEIVAYRLYNAYVRPHFQSLLNVYPILAKSKKGKLEALNRQIYRNIHHWFDATNDEITNLPKFKSVDTLTQIHWSKIIPTIIRTNPSILCDFLQHKMYLLYIYEYYNNPELLEEKRKIVTRGRTSNRIISLFHNYIHDVKSSLLDYVLCF